MLAFLAVTRTMGCLTLTGTALSEQLVADWEEESGGIVYAAILSNMVFGRCLALLYVSAEDEEWELDREDLEGRVPLAYVANLDAPDCSELGSIGIAPANGGLVRTE